MSLNEVQLRNITCKWSSKRMTKPKVQTLEWNDLNLYYCTTYFLHILQGQWSFVQVLFFVLNSFGDADFFIEFGRRSHGSKGRKTV